ncbi:sensor histidine kinase [Novilysobacter selenitireducens]|uniref:histidine kinase n=1 Tax=Novilysobacter selenitireducens TaxID=2872639 RepID=A0ABS7T5G6_9GAMM|nr:sensor histidine kinase [Lysobacter selenitireducens]MBZ4039124.1 MASE1 domain-containing protein [Lysobacter selenitireducens]
MISATHPARPSAQRLAPAFVIAGASAIGQLLSIGFWMPEPQSHMLWLPGAVLMGAALTSPARRWPVYMLAWAAGIVGTLYALALPLVGLVGVALGEGVLILLAAALLRYVSGDDAPLQNFRVLWIFLLVCGAALPAISALWVVHVAARTGLDFYLGSWANVALAHSLSYMLVVPLWLLRASDERKAPFQQRLTNAVLAISLFLGLWVSWLTLSDVDPLRPLLLTAPAPVLVWALIVFRTRGACYALLATSLLCMHMSSRGEGPFVQETLGLTTLACQLWVAWASIAMLFLACLAEQRSAGQRALRATHGELSRMTGRLIVAQEAERSRIARDLHDDINQTLASVSIRLSAIKHEMHGTTRESIDAVQHQIGGVSKSIRQLSHQLHPSVLRYTGLAPALKDLCEGIGQDVNTSTRVALDESIALPDSHALCLYRIAQEALGNARRHADATEIELTLARADGGVQLRIADNGRGWDHDIVAARAKGGLGLVSMEERARALDGRIDVGANPGGGTVVWAVLPVPSMSETP